MSIYDSILNVVNGKNKKKKRMPAPKTVQQSIPYTHIFPDGMIETMPGCYTRAYRLEDISFKIAPDEEQVRIFREWGKLLNSFSTDTNFQIVIQNHAADRRAMLKDIRYETRPDGLDKYRQEMNKILFDKLTTGRNSLKQDKYIVVSVEEDDLEQAKTRLDNIEKELKSSVRKISRSVKVEKMSIEERLENLFGIYHQGDDSVFYNDFDEDKKPVFSFEKLGEAGLTSKDLIAPEGMDFSPAGYFMFGDTYGRAFYLENVPSRLSTEFISDLSDISSSMLISVYHTPIDMTRGMRMIRDHMTAVNAQIANNQKKAIRDGYTPDLISPDLPMAQKQTRDLLDDVMEDDQKLYYLTFTVCLFAPTKEDLDNNTTLVNSVANKHLCPIRRLEFQQEQGFDSSLPLCIRSTEVKRLYTTQSASIFIPYTSMELHQKDGICYGTNQISDNIIMFSRLHGHNYNGLILGESGTGKSFAAKNEIVSAIMRSEDNMVYVLDPEGEYVPLSRAMNGEVIDLSPGSQTYINPLDMDIDYDGESDPVGMKAQYIISMIEIMLGDKAKIDPQAKTIVTRCVNSIYRPYLEHIRRLKDAGSDITCDKKAMPTLNTLYNELLTQPEPEAQTMARIIEPYAVGSFATFAHRSNVETNKNFVVYNIKNLGTGMKDLGLHICLNDIWNKMIENKKKGLWTWIYIDEFYLLLRCDSAAEFLVQVWKRARKWQGVPTAIMQNTEDLLRSQDSRDIINNTSFIIMMSLKKLDRANVGDLLQIPESQLDYLTGRDRGSGILYTPGATLPFKYEFPEDTELFSLMSTSPYSN